MKPKTLLLLRVSLGLFLVVWGGDKLVNVEHGLAVSDRFYLGLLSSPTIQTLVGVLEIVLGALIVLGLARRISYVGMLLIYGATLLAVWRSILDPLEMVMEGGNPVFFSSLIIFAASLVLWAFRDEDTHAMDHTRAAAHHGSSATGGASVTRS